MNATASRLRLRVMGAGLLVLATASSGFAVLSLSNETRLTEPTAKAPHGIVTANVVETGGCPGCLDLVTANQSGGSVSILAGNGNGTFTAVGSNILVGSSPLAIDAGDCNGDGLPDLFVANQGDSTVTVLVNGGGGTFTQASGSPISISGKPVDLIAKAGPLPTSPALDLNGDSVLDLALAIKGSDKLVTLFGSGSCTFSVGQSTTIYGGNGPVSIAAGDLDGTNGVDLVVADAVSGMVTILLNNGSGTFPTSCAGLCHQYAAGSMPTAVMLADADGDGDLDILELDSDNGAVPTSTGLNRFLNDGAGNFSAFNSFGTGGKGPIAGVAANVGGDGNVDVVAVNQTAKTLGVALGQGASGFGSAATPAEGGTGSQDITAGDFNGDGLIDVAVANQTTGNYSACLNSVGSPGTFTCTTGAGAASGFGSNVRGVAIADMGTASSTTPDGYNDIVFVNESSDDVSILINNPGFSSLYKPPMSLSANATTLRDVIAFDADHDGITDLAIAACGGTGTSKDRVVVVRDQNFTASGTTHIQYLGANDCPTAVVALDINGDGWADLVAANQNSGDVSIFKNDGTGGFILQANVCVVGSGTCSNSAPTDVAVADFGTSASDGTLDNKLDLAVSCKNIDSFVVLFSNGNFGFANSAPVGAIGNGQPSSIAVGYFNADTKVDVAITNHNTANSGVTKSNGAQVFLGQGGNVFSSPTSLYTDAAPTAIVATNVSGDTGGRTDLIVATEGGDDVLVYEGRGDGIFNGGVAKTTGLNPRAVAVGDLNPTSPADIVTANYGTSDLSLITNTSAVCGDAVVSGGETCDAAPGTVCSTGCASGHCSTTCTCQ